MIFPITYAMIIIWIILMVMNDANYWNRFIYRMSAVLLGNIIGLKSIAGEQWLAIDSSNVLSMQSFNDGFALPLGLILILISSYIAITLGLSLLENDYKKESSYHG